MLALLGHLGLMKRRLQIYARKTLLGKAPKAGIKKKIDQRRNFKLMNPLLGNAHQTTDVPMRMFFVPTQAIEKLDDATFAKRQPANSGSSGLAQRFFVQAILGALIKFSETIAGVAQYPVIYGVFFKIGIKRGNGVADAPLNTRHSPENVPVSEGQKSYASVRVKFPKSPNGPQIAFLNQVFNGDSGISPAQFLGQQDNIGKDGFNDTIAGGNIPQLTTQSQFAFCFATQRDALAKITTKLFGRRSAGKPI
jgi:hypothetical protein